MFLRLFWLSVGLPEVFGRRLSGVLLPKNEYKKDTLHNTECLIVFNVFFLRIRTSVESKSFCTFGLNSVCLITNASISWIRREEVPSGELS